MTPDQRALAAAEELRRRELRLDLRKWAHFVGAANGWVMSKHHDVMHGKLQALTDGTMVHSKTGDPCRNLIVMMPPGSSKSEHVSGLFPAWYVQRKPKSRLLGCSFAVDLMNSFSYKARGYLTNYANELGTTLRKDSRAVDEWHTTNGSSFKSAGVGGGISGRRADFALVDDYIGSEEDANSKTMRDKIWTWWQGDLFTRLKPHGIRVIVANRRHEDDLIGRILAKEETKWEVVSFPFFAEDNDLLGRQRGERLWPEYFTEDMAVEIRTLAPRIIAGLYQQRPAPEEGNFFLREWLLTYDMEEYNRVMRKDLRVFGAGDWAVSTEEDANKTCLGGCVLDEDGTMYVLPDLFWKVAGPKEVVSEYMEFLRRRNPLQFWSEKGHISKSWGPFLREKMLDEGIYNYITEVAPSKDKEVRAGSIRGRMSMLRVKFPAFASWWPEAMHELLTFPGGKNDDFVDFLAHLGMGLNSMTKAQRPSDVPRGTLAEALADPQPITLEWVKASHRDRFKVGARYGGR